MSDLGDPELRDALRRASGDDCDTVDALVRVEARVRRIRRRRMDVAGLALLVALVVTLGIASRAHQDESPGRPASNVTVAPPVVSTPVATGAATTTPPDTTPPDTAPPDTAPVTGAAAAAAPVSTDPAPPDTAAPAATAAPERAADDAGTSPAAAAEAQPHTQDTPATDQPAPASTRPAPKQQTYSSDGGWVTVTVAGDSLRLAEANARPGYTAGPPSTDGAAIDVEFRSRSGRSRIHVELANGRVQPRITNDDAGGTDGDGDRRPSRTTSITSGRTATSADQSSTARPSRR